MSRITRTVTITLSAVLLFGVFALAGWAITERLASTDVGAAEFTEIPIVPAQSVEPLPDITSILVSPDGDRPEEADDESTWVVYETKGDATDGLADPPTTDESNFGDPLTPYRDDGPRAAGFPTDAFPPEPDESESTVDDPAADPDAEPAPPTASGGTVPIPDEPGPIGPSVPTDGDTGTFVPLLEDFDPWAFPTPVPRLVDPCTTAAESDDAAEPDDEACGPGFGGTIVPLSHEALSIFDITSDVGGRCEGQFSEVPRDSFGIAIFSNRPGVFEVTSQPTSPGSPGDEATVGTPASQIARWDADESVTVTTCVALDRVFSDGASFEESRYRVRVIDTDPLALFPSMVERLVTVPPTGRPEVLITPTGDRSFAVSVPARSDEEVIVALLPRVGSVDDVCGTIDVPRWEWPDGAVGLAPLGRERIVLPFFFFSPFSDVDPSFNTRHHFEATVDSDAPLAVCVLWFADFVPSPVVTERQSYAIDPPSRPHAAISIFAISDSGGGEEDVLVPEARARLEWRVHDASGAHRCVFAITDASDLPSGPCEFDVLRGGGVVPITLTGFFRRSAGGALATSSADAEVPIYEAPPVVRALDVDSYTCSEPTCRAVTAVTINGPNERGVQYVFGTAAILIEITNGGDYDVEWRIRPTGPFTAEGEPAPDHVQLNFASSAVTLDPQFPAAVLRVNWETDRPALVSASWGAPHAPLSNRTPPRDSRFPPQPVSCGGAPPGGVNPGSGRLQTEGQMILPVRCPATPFEVTLRVEGEDGTVVEYGAEPTLGGISYPWDGGLIRTEPLAVLVEWEVRHRMTRSRERIDTTVDSGGGWDIATHLQLGTTYTYEERHSSWIDRPACGDYDDYDTDSDGPIRFEVGPEFQIILWTETWRWSACDLVGGAVGEAVRGSPLVNIYRDSFINENWTFVSVVDVLRENQPLVFVTSVEDCFGGCLHWLTSELVVTIRLENELYRQPDILGG
ncbi:MAG: hypothetical protein IH941_10020 [Acidobacteria bacterium]|nr:hypothetical protein [Acidobacteriota bacterium]